MRNRPGSAAGQTTLEDPRRVSEATSSSVPIGHGARSGPGGVIPSRMMPGHTGPNRWSRMAALASAFCLSFLLPPVAPVDAASVPAAHEHDDGDTAAISCDSFLSSLGVDTHVDQGYAADAYVRPLQYLGVRDIRDGTRHLAGLLMLHRKTGVVVDLLGSADVTALTAAARQLAAGGALLALEGPNEPGNFPVEFNGERGGGTGSWVPVARVQQSLYKAVKADPALAGYPVFHVSEGGAETDNVGIQFLTIPAGADTSMPDGTRFADYANVHNYVIGNHHRYVDNEAWLAADPELNSYWDGLYGEYGRTWRKRYAGYSDAQLEYLPRVTTETGWDSVADPGGEPVQGKVLVNTYLAQFARGWRYTFIYELRDNEGGAGHQGLFHEDGTPKPAATYIHNLTSILADKSPLAGTGRLDFSMPERAETVHDLLLEKSDKTFELVIWGEQTAGSRTVSIHFQSPHPLVKIYDVTQGAVPIRTLTNVTDIALPVSDHALIIETR